MNPHQPMGHVPVSGKFERVAMDLLDVSVISAKGHKYILVVCDYFTKYTRSATGSSAQLVVPLSLRDTVFNDSHHTTYGGHFGMTHTHTARYSYITSGLECQISSGTESLHVTSVLHANHQ